MKYKYVKDIMSSPAITIESDEPIKKAIELMKKKNIGFLPVTKSNIIIGVLTDRDILIRGIGIHKTNSKTEKIMTGGEIHFVSPSTPLVDAAKIMSKNKIRRLVVIDDGYVKGVLTTKNLLKEKEYVSNNSRRQEPSLISYIIDTYGNNDTLPHYEIYDNSNPHDSVKAADYPL